MLNFKKFSQALLLAIGLTFASSVVTLAQAEADDPDDVNIHEILDKYTKSEENVKKSGKTSRAQTKARNAKESASTAKAKADETVTILYPDEDGDSTVEVKVNKYDQTIEYMRYMAKRSYEQGQSKTASAWDKKMVEAEDEKKAVNRQVVASEYANIAAQDKVIASAEKDKKKAQKKLDKANEEASKACAKNPKSSSCIEARQKQVNAGADILAADKAIKEANKNKTEAQKDIEGRTSPSVDEWAVMDEASIAADEAKDARKEAEDDRAQKLNKANKKAKEADRKYQEEVAKLEKDKRELTELKAKCRNDQTTEKCETIDDKEKKIRDAQNGADKLYREKVEADNALAKATQEVGAARAQDAKEVAEATAENRKEMADALQKEAQADVALAAAQEKAAQKCKNRNSKACQKAIAELETAQKGALSAKQEAIKLKAKYGASTDASSVLNEQDVSEYNNAKEQAKSVCKSDKTTDDCKEATEKLNALAAKHVDNATKRKEAKEAEIAALEEQLKEAEAACGYSKTLESKQGQAQAVDYCTQVELLKQDIALAQNQKQLLESDLSTALGNLDNLDNKNNGLAQVEEDHSGQEFRAFSTAIGRVDKGEYSGDKDYSNTGDIFETVTRRAARIIVGLKPIVYIFAGFGLIAFAFAAIFNKISWKWFANIAIGLFLVANMGRLIEYMVLNTTKTGIPHAPEDVTKFGNHLHEYFADTEYMWVDVVEPFTPTDVTIPEENKPNTEVAPSEKPKVDERGFCKRENEDAKFPAGGGSFMSCVKDLVASGKKVVDAAKKVKNTVDTVKTAVDVATNAVDNIVEAANKMKSGDLKQIIGAVGEIGNNVNTIIASGGNVIRNTINNTSGIANDIQDVSKSREQQNALRVRRDSGEATNAVDAVMQGQKWDKGSKSVERLYDGSIANNKKNGNNNGQTGFEDVVDKVTKGSQSVNNQLQGMKDNAYIGTQTVEGIIRSVGGSSALSGSSSNSAQADDVSSTAEEFAQAKSGSSSNSAQADDVSSKAEKFAQANKSYSQAISNAKNAANTASRLAKEAENKKQAAEAAKEKYNLTGLEADRAVADLAEAEYNLAKEEAEYAHQEAKKAEQDLIEAEKARQDAAKAAAEEKVETLKAKRAAAEEAKNAAQKAYDEAKNSDDLEATKKAEEDLREKRKAYNAANIEALKAEAEYKSLIEDKEKIKGFKLMDEYNASKVAEEATDALNTAQREAQAANRDLTKKQEDLLKAKQELHEAEARAKRSGSSVDKAAVEVAKEKVRQAEEAEEAAQQVAKEKKAVVEPLAEKAHTAKLEESKYLQTKAEEEIKEHDSNVDEAKKVVNDANVQYTAAAKAAEEARKKAEQTRDPVDIARAKAAAEARDKAKKDLDKAQADLAKEKQALNQAEMDKRKAAQAEAELSQTSQDIKAGVLRNEADVLRDIYGGKMDPLTASQQLNDEYKKAVAAAQQAENKAKSADEKAKRAQQIAEEAAKQAEKSGKDSDKRKAEELEKRALLAASEADKAKEAADQASEPLKDLENKVYEASVEANEYQQEVLNKTMSEAKEKIEVYSTNLTQQEDAKNAAYQLYKKAEAAAYADPSDDAAVVDAKRAYDAYLKAQTAYAQAQKQLEAEMKRYNEAELELYSARTKEAELREQRQSAEN